MDVREGDAVLIRLYLVLKRGAACDASYSATGKEVELYIRKPNGEEVVIPTTAVESDDPDIANSMVEHTITGHETSGNRGTWLVVARVPADGVTFGTLRFKVVDKYTEVGQCA